MLSDVKDSESTPPMIEFRNVLKYYKADGRKKVVLDHVSFVFERGYSYGLLGVNGAGKSTTMRLLSGVEMPNAGAIKRSVRVSWPLGFASAFNALMTGRNNVTFAARAYGQNVRRVLEFVEDFTELGDYLDAPIKTYSSGMAARLAFALSMAIDFECYLIDELTAVGDARFSARCEEAFAERRKRSDVIMVSHSVGTIKTFCSRGGVLIDGKMMMFPDIDQAIDVYNRLNR
jgi:capsular polysaccharide transport system ATP-binding protein